MIITPEVQESLDKLQEHTTALEFENKILRIPVGPPILAMPAI